MVVAEERQKSLSDRVITRNIIRVYENEIWGVMCRPYEQGGRCLPGPVWCSHHVVGNSLEFSQFKLSHHAALWSNVGTHTQKKKKYWVVRFPLSCIYMSSLTPSIMYVSSCLVCLFVMSVISEPIHDVRFPLVSYVCLL